MEEQRRAGRPNRQSGRVLPGPPAGAKSGQYTGPVDREKACPLLIRVFHKLGRHHSVEDFSVRAKVPKDEVQIHTWLDATLNELTDLVNEVAPEARKREAILSFAFVFPSKTTGRIMIREVGKTYSYPSQRVLNRGNNSYPPQRKPDDGNKSLIDLTFQIGDFLDVAIFRKDIHVLGSS